MSPAIMHREAAVGELERSQNLLAEIKGVLSAGSGGGGGGGGDGVALVEEATKAIAFVIDALREGAEEAGAGGKRKCGEASAAEKPAAKKRRPKAKSWTVTSVTLDDGHSWRKYGQKNIQNTEYPRSYYKCSFKNSRGCQAIKQVQQSKDDLIYEIKYIGEHTCMDCFKSKSSSSLMNQPCMIDFEPEKQLQDAHPSCSPLLINSLNKEHDDILCQNELSLEHLLQHISTSLETSMISFQESNMVSKQEDVTSDFHTSTSIMNLDDPFITNICNFRDDTFEFLDI